MRRVQIVIKKESKDSRLPLTRNKFSLSCSHMGRTWAQGWGCQSLWAHPPHFRVSVYTFSSLHTWTATGHTVL